MRKSSKTQSRNQLNIVWINIELLETDLLYQSIHTHILTIWQKKFKCKWDERNNILHVNGKFDYDWKFCLYFRENKKKASIDDVFVSDDFFPSLFIYKSFSYSNNCFFVRDSFFLLHRLFVIVSGCCNNCDGNKKKFINIRFHDTA